MPRKIPISVCLFTTTRPRWGFIDCYKHTIERLNQSIPLSDFGNLSAHIKISDDSHFEKADEMEDWLSGRGFNVLRTHKNWDKVGDQHAEGYYGDMYTLMSTQAVQNQPYMLLLEDDWLINGEDLIGYFKKGVELLKKNKDVLCVRVNDEINQDVSRATKIGANIYAQNKDYTKFGETLTFQPTILRVRDWYAAVRFINKNWHQLKGNHCELVSGSIMKYLFSDKEEGCFTFFDPAKLSAKHIGTEEFANEHR